MQMQHQLLPLTLKHRFIIARGGAALEAGGDAQPEADVRRNVLVRLTDDQGRTGFGEAAPVGYIGQSVRQIQQDLDRLAPAVEAISDPTQLARFEQALKQAAPGASAARVALSMAAHDLAGQQLGAPLWRLWGLSPEDVPATSFTIGLDRLDVMLAKVEEVRHWPVLKLKVGVPGDLEALRQIRRIYDGVLRVDANGGWEVQQGLELLPKLADLGVEYVEQPVPREDIEGLARLKRARVLPIFADESSLFAAELPRLIGAVDGINIKLMKCGGLREAHAMIAFARAVGWQVMLGCMIESSLAITAAAHLAPLADHIDLDGALLLSQDPFRGVYYEEARPVLPRDPGLGVVVESR